MSCNGCRVLRKGCSDACILRSCLQWIESPEAQGHATVFVAKFFGRAGMISFISAVSESQRPALFQSLLYEACGRTVNPVFGAVGLLWSGNWAACQAAVETVLKGGSLKPATCLPASNKSVQPLVPNESQAPPRNAASKRSYDMIDTNLDVCVEEKRLRSADQHPEFLDCQAQQPGTIRVDSSSIAINNPFSATNTIAASKVEEQPSLSGQLVAPVARRVKPQAPYGFAAICIREATTAGENQRRDFVEQAMPSHESVQLDLTLNSHAHHVSCRPAELLSVVGGKPMIYSGYPLGPYAKHAVTPGACNEEEGHAFFEGAARASSPCSFSMNSEGSVISSDTVEVSASCVRGFSSPTIARLEDRQLLHLL